MPEPRWNGPIEPLPIAPDPNPPDRTWKSNRTPDAMLPLFTAALAMLPERVAPLAMCTQLKAPLATLPVPMGVVPYFRTGLGLALGKMAAISEAVGLTRQAVFAWKRCPPQHAIEVERVSGVSRHDLRPDIYGKAP